MGFVSSVISRVVSGMTRRRPEPGTGTARDMVLFSDAYIVDHFGRLGYAVDLHQLVYTLESVETYASAREQVWHQPGHVAVYDEGGLLIVENAQPRPLQPTRDIVVVSLGDARVVMGVIDRSVGNRYAETM